MSQPANTPISLFRSILIGVAVLVVSMLAAQMQLSWLPLFPTTVALCVVLLTRKAAAGLMAGVISGALQLCEGSAHEFGRLILFDLFLPIFDSPWKLSAILFTLILGGFVALLEAGGGLRNLLHRIHGSGNQNRMRTQLTVSGFGLAVFFDGLANSMLVGRVMRSFVDRAGVSRVKLAYLADTTSSAVACVAFISTWIAFQLSMIREGYRIAGHDVDPYRLFFLSLPANFYCWFALCLVFVCILRDFNPGPMARYEHPIEAAKGQTESDASELQSSGSHWAAAILPLLVLIFSVPVISYLIGASTWFPFSLTKFAEAYGNAERYVPQIMVMASIFAALAAAVAYWLVCRFKSNETSTQTASTPSVFISGVRDLAQPVLILLAAWMLGGVISKLGAADFITSVLDGRLPLELFPASIFITGALISFSTGTSWGTMGVLMPLAIPVVFAITGDPDPASNEALVIAAIAAVFSGAVFGDHCSPFSDTTLVSSIAAGVDPIDHVKTQLPFALIAAFLAAVIGFIPMGFGVSPLWLVPIGFITLTALPSIPFFKTNHDTN